ncbi:hypothetical protein OO306_00045 [Pseudomonas sp. DCB_AW]|uniref:hypothetical protein n=1 Tax=Pseudomonas sp. DCB_AW TaxID=2993596 RepID=UPI002248B1CF|nr:hypothetical protein [Pseudomonas sp. DCB_AW]MCX2683935.1 hypothetical protein [Pseudomonas sp. DCB_AW]
MFKELIFTKHPQTAELPFIGGEPYIPKATPWPTDKLGNPLLHLASLPASFITKQISGLTINSELLISIFTPYSKSDQYIEIALNEGGKVLAYPPCKIHSSTFNPALESHLISIVENPEIDTSDNGIAKIGGIPSWLQDKEETNLKFILQINNSRLNKSAPNHKGILVGGIGYLLLKKEIIEQDQAAGSFVIQTT